MRIKTVLFRALNLLPRCVPPGCRALGRPQRHNPRQRDALRETVLGFGLSRPASEAPFSQAAWPPALDGELISSEIARRRGVAALPISAGCRARSRPQGQPARVTTKIEVCTCAPLQTPPARRAPRLFCQPALRRRALGSSGSLPRAGSGQGARLTWRRREGEARGNSSTRSSRRWLRSARGAHRVLSYPRESSSA